MVGQHISPRWAGRPRKPIVGAAQFEAAVEHLLVAAPVALQ